MNKKSHRSLNERLISIMIEASSSGAPDEYGPLYQADRALISLLSANLCKIPDLDDQNFHKAFRSWDVTGNGDTDMAIYHLIHASNLFWDVRESILDNKPFVLATTTGEE